MTPQWLQHLRTIKCVRDSGTSGNFEPLGVINNYSTRSGDIVCIQYNCLVGAILMFFAKYFSR